MKTQIAKDSFRPRKRYSGVYQQQGRMLSDADWNELMAVVKYRLDDVLRDVIGSGTPRERGLVQVDSSGAVSLHWGYVYVDGIVAEVRPDATAPAGSSSFDYTKQQDFPQAPAIAGSDYRLYVDVWERPVTSLEDEDLRDPGLHGADTCTRTRTMAQIKWCPTTLDPEDPNANPPQGDARLTLGLRTGTTGADPCDPCADEVALPNRVGNYLFRLEVQDVVRDSTGMLEQITLKWSSENGAEQHVAGEEPPGFVGDNWVYEFFSGPEQDSVSEQHLGRHLVTASGFPVRSQLYEDYPDTLPEDFPLVRRWDGYCVLDRQGDGTWQPATDSDGDVLGQDRGRALSTTSDASDPGHVTPGVAPSFNLDAVFFVLDLDGHQVIAGDYWTTPVREAVDRPGDTLLTQATPHGILHHYMTLAEVSGETVTPYNDDQCKRIQFPPLTDLQAGDVCYDNTTCELPGAENVQQALDALCQQRDLRFHNKHLHGWGIVCGLEVHCGPDTLPDPETGEMARQQATVKPGYAIDCDGYDIVLDQAQHLDVLERVTAYDQAHPNNPILSEAGDGSACLTLARGSDGQPVYEIEAYDPQSETWGSILDGTIWQDFWEHCIQDLWEAIQEEFTADEDTTTSTELVSPAHKRFVELFHLFMQLMNAQAYYLFMAKREHDILEQLYNRLRALLQSKTFCAMFQGEAFPAYPFPNSQQDTIFGKGFHARLRLAPDGKTAYTCRAGGNQIHVYDLGARALSQVLTMNAGEGAEIQDLAVAPDGNKLYAIATLAAGDTVLGIADIDGEDYQWRPVRVLCGIELMTLTAAQNTEGRVYAIGKNKGLFVLNPESLAETVDRSQPKYAFNAVGQLSIDEANGWAYATANSGQFATSTYNQWVGLNVGANMPEGDNLDPQRQVDLVHPANNQAATGHDDLIWLPQSIGEQGRLCVVVNARPDMDFKELLFFDPTNADATPEVRNVHDSRSSALRLGYYAPSQQLLVTVEDSYKLQVFNADGATAAYRHPVHVSPIDVASHGETDFVYVLNFMSNTINVIPGAELETSGQYLDSLADYRRDVLLAFWQLLSGLLQYLKDCFCDRLLIKCPTCDEEDKIYLAGIELRDNQIYNICNFSKRKYVKSFPTVEYWMSLVPVLPMIKQAVTRMCCSVLPDWFQGAFEKYFNFAVGGEEVATTQRVKGSSLRRGTQFYQHTDFRGAWRAEQKALNTYSFLAKDAAINRWEGAPLRKPGIDRSTVLNQPVGDVQARLQKADVQVREVKTYDEQDAGRQLKAFGGAPLRLNPGAKVTLHERDGKVLFYTVEEEEAAIAGVSEETKQQIEQLRRQKEELQELGEVRAELAKAEARRAELANLETVKQEINQLDQQKASVKQELDSLKAEVAGLQEQKQNLTQMQENATQLKQDLDAMAQRHQDLQIAIAKDRPVNELPDVSPEMDNQLRELGVRTMGELSSMDEERLAGANIDTNTARNLINEANRRIKPSG